MMDVELGVVLIGNAVKKAIDYARGLVSAFRKAGEADSRAVYGWLAGAWVGLTVVFQQDLLPLIESTVGAVDGWADSASASFVTLAAGSSIYDVLKRYGITDLVPVTVSSTGDGD